jgi:hypothetical protein
LYPAKESRLMPPTRPQDPRVPEIVKHLRILARRHNRRLVVQDYLEYRAKYAPHLPALTTVYRLLGSWPEALAAAGVEQTDKAELSRTSDESLVAALKEAAEALDIQVLSSHAYDEYRKSNAPHLPSSSVIRKWLGRWAEAVKLAGLETTERSAPRKPTLAEIIEALRLAKSRVDGMLTPRTYSEFHSALPEEERKHWPDVTHVLTQFPNWETALRNADVEQSDELHPQALWTAEEARRIMQQVERVLGHTPDEREYGLLRQRARKPMPAWDVLMWLLSA